MGRRDGRAGNALCDPTAPAWLRQVPAGALLRKVWRPQDQFVDGAVPWRSSQDLPPASCSISAPSDEEAHSARQRRAQGAGDTGPVTDTCDAQRPVVGTHVDTTAAPLSADALTAPMHAEIARRAPGEPRVDAGSGDAHRLVDSQQNTEGQAVDSAGILPLEGKRPCAQR